MSKSFSELAQVNPGVELPSGATAWTDVSFVPMSDVSESGELTGRQVRKLGDVRSGFTSFADEDILVAKITPCFENGKGAHVQGLKNGVGFGSTEFHVLRARSDSNARYLHHIVQSARFRRMGEVFMTGSAGQKRVPREFFDAFEVPSLPMAEQQKIAQILDTLDTTIRQTEAIIAKLKQVKQGLLHDLLPRGIDANGELRPPQSEAPHLYKASPLGWIPVGWDARNLSESIELISGQHIEAELCNSLGKGVPYFTGPSDFLGAGTVVTQYTTQPQVMCDETDILITVKGSGCGKVAVSGVRACISRQLMAIKIPTRAMQFWLNTLQSHQDAFNRMATGGNIPGISRTQILDFLVATPCDLDEMHEIGERIQSIESRIASENAAIVKLTALKSGLMDDLLTGRVRVTPLLAQAQATQP